MDLIHDDIKRLADEIARRSIQESECFPVDRYFLEQYLDRISAVNKIDFLLYNLENINNTYTVQLMLCLPELWEDIDVNDLISLTNQFTNIFSFYGLILFTYKYLEVDIIELILKSRSIAEDFKRQIKEYLKTQYPNFLKSEGEIFVLDESVIGVKDSDWKYIKQKLLLDSRIKECLETVEDLEKYVNSI